jgi:hypothetical protein
MAVIRKVGTCRGSDFERRSLKVAFATIAIVTFCQGAARHINAVNVHAHSLANARLQPS